jgi:hypothetical protein
MRRELSEKDRVPQPVRRRRGIAKKKKYRDEKVEAATSCTSRGQPLYYETHYALTLARVQDDDRYLICGRAMARM